MHRSVVLGFAAFSGTGKTTLLEQVMPCLKVKGLRIGVIKASHHNMEFDVPGKDSYRLRHSGAVRLLLAMPERSVCFTDNPEPCDPDFNHQLQLIQGDDLDIILVEGFRDAPIPKIEVHRQVCDKPFLFNHDPWIMAVACDQDTNRSGISLPCLDINQPDQVSAYIFDYWQQHTLNTAQEHNDE
ncbi:Molybdopterin-guanine dinucleotide biosynthesis adapter protein [invertebrate metagenome]|uniref:Molybdopterin-guanine dinucleotide biosynthesis adapter protein n=1 Tax=invertebrate metagenome TaxID=1711999 RepID=A0A2H9T872_9ZZZZ